MAAGETGDIMRKLIVAAGAGLSLFSGLLVCSTVAVAAPGGASTPGVRDYVTVTHHQETWYTDTFLPPFAFGVSGDLPVVGDWDGNGSDGPGVRRGATFLLRNAASSGVADYQVVFGRATDTPIVGDWDGNGTTTIGVWRAGVFYLRNSNTPGPADVVIGYGRPSDHPIIGDWDGNGTSDPGVRRGATFYLPGADIGREPGTRTVVTFGRPGDQVLIGDWPGSGRDLIGVDRASVVSLVGDLKYLDNAGHFVFGRPTDIALAGDLAGYHEDSVLVVRV